MYHVLKGKLVDPTTTPTRIGQHWINTVLKRHWLSVGTSSPTDWVLQTSGSLFYDNIDSFPPVGTPNVLYIANNNNKIYKWNGSSYIEVSTGVTDHNQLTNIGLLTHEELETAIDGKENIGVAASLMTAHESALDPHSQYATDTDLSNHVNNTSNPHNVTKAQVGLSLVDNTSDLNKPISTATQTALDLKADITYVDTEIDAAIASAYKYISDYNASTNTPDLTTTPNSIKVGHTYVVSVAGTFFGENVEIGDQLICKLDSPSLLSHWSRIQKNVDNATIKTMYEANANTNAFTDAEKTKLSGIEALAEVNNISDVNATDLTDGGDSTLHYHATDRNRSNHTGTQTASTISDFTNAAQTAVVAQTITDGVTTTAPSQNAVYDALALKQDTITGAATTITSSNLTASRALASDTNGKVSVATTTLAELNFVNGVTSGIQGQLNGKEPTITAGTTLQYWRGDKTWQTLNTSVVPESGNLYFTDARVRAAVLTGYVLGSNTALASTDSVLQAFQKIQGQINARESTANKGVANGYASLDASGLVPTGQLPSYVDDVLEYANLAAFPITGEAGKIYVALDTNKTYRWSGSVYVYITSGAVDSVFGRTGVVTAQTNDYTWAQINKATSSIADITTRSHTLLTDVGTRTHVQLESDIAGKEPTITAGTTAQYWRGDKSWQTLNTTNVVEGTNLYYTDVRAQASITGGASTIVTSNLTADRALVSNVSGKVSVSSISSTELLNLAGTTTSVVDKNYLSSRELQLVTNFSAGLGTNYNFTSYTLDQVDTPFGIAGSFKASTSAVRSIDEYISINPNRVYELSANVKQSVGGTGAFYLGLTCYDIDFYAIEANAIMYQEVNSVTLSRTYTVGDSFLYLSANPNWTMNEGSSFRRGIIAWNYTNSKGYTYPIFTYSRNYFYNMWTTSATATFNGTDWEIPVSITPTVGNASSIPAGTRVSRTSSGSAAKYVAASNVTTVPTVWGTVYSGLITGLDTSGTNYNNSFAPGTAYVKVMSIFNLGGSGTTYIAGVSLKEKDTGFYYSVSAGGGNYAVASELFTPNSNFYYNQSSNLLGIGTQSPSSKLHIKGSGATSATKSLKVDNSSNSEIFSIRDDGRVKMYDGLGFSYSGGASGRRLQLGDSFNESHASVSLTLAGTNPGIRQEIHRANSVAFAWYMFDGHAYDTTNLTSINTMNQGVYGTNIATPLYMYFAFDNAGVGATPHTTNSFRIYSPSTGITTNVNTKIGEHAAALARLHVKGSGSTSATKSLKIDNSSNTEILSVRDDGLVSINQFVSAKTANYTILNTEGDTLFTNTGATGEVNFTLPTAAAGLEYRFYTNAAQILRVTAAAGDVIRRGSQVTAAAGNVATTASLGNYFELVAIDATSWIMISSTENGAYTFT